MRFTKMQGAGNDYIYVDATKEKLPDNLSQLAIKLSNRNFGIGSDGLVLIHNSTVADFRMQMLNSDGSESEMCGNAIRCVAKYVYDRGMIKGNRVKIETLAGIKDIELITQGSKAVGAKVDMGSPILEPEKIPVDIKDVDRVISYPLMVDGQEYKITCVSMGNPHCVVFCDDIADLNLTEIGPKFEHHKVFPRRTNTEFIKIISRNEIDMRVWERGAGETLACGTGACAAVVACVLNGYTENEVKVNLLGGKLKIKYDGTVLMSGEAVEVFEGEINVCD